MFLIEDHQLRFQEIIDRTVFACNLPFEVTFKESKKGSREMLVGGSKSKAATQAGYFAETFPRILEGEAYSDQVKMRRQYRLKEAQKNIAKPFIPSNGDKFQSVNNQPSFTSIFFSLFLLSSFLVSFPFPSLFFSISLLFLFSFCLHSSSSSLQRW